MLYKPTSSVRDTVAESHCLSLTAEGKRGCGWTAGGDGASGSSGAALTERCAGQRRYGRKLRRRKVLAAMRVAPGGRTLGAARRKMRGPCSCSIPGDEPTSNGNWLPGMLGLSLLLRRRRNVCSERRVGMNFARSV
jgi:MYXO-CTERM domain-containing protein